MCSSPGGALVWPLALLLHFATLRRLDDMPPQRWWSWVHSGGVWLIVLLVGNLLVSGATSAVAGYGVGLGDLSAASVLVLLALTTRALYDAESGEVLN